MSTGFVLNIPQEMLNRLEDADKKIEKLARTSEDAQARIVSAFKSMGTNGVDAFIQRLDVAQQKLAQLGGTQINMGINANTGGFQQLIDAINKLSQASKTNITINGLGTVGNQTQTAIDAINKLMATLQQLQQMGGQQFLGGVNNLGRQTLREMNKEARKMQKTMQDLDDAIQKYGISATDLANKLQQARQAQQQFNDAAKQQAQADVSGLIGMKGQQTTLNELKNYANELKRTMANLDPKSQEWKKLNDIYKQTNREIKNIQNSMKDVQKQSRSLMDISGQLARRLALVFSVSQITGYIKKLIEVRGEFELQQRSLQAILQNKDEANRIWQQTVDLAVRSPFRVKELVSYTKQLAAYRIESDKLFETNKMLADISAGLGVDMQRLILAFGQVRSAAYLRGTELRQFTEAGIPILEQLAQYFTELEGRAVSVGDVFERVSKRMVSFADVEEIFKRMTAEGGSFYRMQEIQAETLKGMWSNLKDSIDLMLNEIGKANEGTLKGSIQSVKELVDGWRDLAFAIKLVLVPLGTYFTITSGIRFANNTFSQGLLMMAMNFKTTSNWLIKAEKSIVGLVTKMGLGKTAAAGFAKALGGLASLGVAGIIAGIVVGLVALITKLTSASRAAKQLNKDLQAIYNEDTATLKTQIRGFENLIGRLKEANTNTRERKEIISQINSQYGEYLGFIVDEKTSYEQLANSINSVTLALTRRAKATSFEKALTEVYGKTNEAIAESEKVLRDTMDDLFATQVDGKALSLLPNEGEIIKIFDLIDKKTIELGRPLESSEIREVLEGFYGYFVSFNTTKKEAADFMSAIEKRGQAVLTQREKELEIDRRINEVYKENAESAAEATKAFKELEERRTAALSDAKGAPKWEIEKIKRDFEVEKIDLQVKYEGLDKATADLRKKTLESMNATVNDINKKVEGSISKLGEKYANLIYIDETEAATGINQIAESTAAAYKAQKEILKQQNSLKEAGTAYDADILKNAQKSADAYYYKLQLLGRLDLLQKETTKEETKEMKLLRQQLAALKEAGQTYQSLRQDFDKETATQKTASAFKDLFAELKMTDLTKGMSFDELGILKVLEELPNKAGDAGKKAIEKLRAEFLSERDVEAQRKRSKLLLASIQEEFDRYDLSLELKKLNIPPDLAKSLFDVDYLDLDGLKKAVQEQEAKFIGTDMEKEYKNFLDKIADMEDKAAKERMKTYSKYLLEGMSERVKLKIEEMRKLKEIEESDEFTPEQKERIKAGVSKEARAEQQKQEWKDFQGTEMYTMMFEDLEHYGTAAIDMLYTKLSELKTSLSDLPASEVKEIVGQIEKLENIKIESNPFEYLKKYKEEVKNIGFTEGELQAQLLDSQKAEEEAQKYIDIYNTVMQSLMSEDEGVFEEIDAETLVQWNEMLRLAEELGKTVEEILADRKATVKAEQDNQGKIVKNLNSYKKLSKAQKDSLELTQEWLEQIGNIFSSSKELMESLGVESDSVAMTIADTGSSMVSLIQSATQFTLQLQLMGIAANSALGVIGWIAIAIQAVATVLSAIFSAKDKALQKEIDGHLARAEKLHEKYEELSDAIDSAYDASVVRQFNKEIEKTIQLEIKAIEAAIAAEKSQKDSKIDWGWVDEQEKKVKELYNTLNEEHDNYIERWGGFGSDEARLDFIESMTQAWLDSFKETGDGLDGLEEKWDEYFDNLAMKQMALRVSKTAIDKYLGMWDKYVSAESAGGEDLTEAEAQDLRLKKEQLLKELSEKYTSLAESLGITPTTEGGGLSALSKSIQGVSESTAQVLESLLNSMRFYVADSNAKLTQLLNNMMGGETESPMLAELRAQTKWMRDIYNLINGMTATHPSGGRGIKTVM